MTLLDVLISIREQIIQYAETDNRKEAEDLFITLATLREISYHSPNRELTGVIIDLLDTTRDIIMGVRGKSNIPSVEDIQAVFTASSEAS